jgi:hypothetical protein
LHLPKIGRHLQGPQRAARAALSNESARSRVTGSEGLPVRERTEFAVSSDLLTQLFNSWSPPVKNLFAILLAVLVLTAVPAQSIRSQERVQTAGKVPDRLSDAEFWSLVTDISEPGGYFRITDNFTSNEMEVAEVMTRLRTTKVSGGAYIGVGPEQNFSYIAAIRPAVAFIIDIRRQAVMQHLMFKALFELSATRADFVSLTFSKGKPAGVDTIQNIQFIWNSFLNVPTDTALARKNYQRVLDHLTKTHSFRLTNEEIESLRWVWDAFTQYGPAINTQAAQGGGGFGGRGANRGNFITLTAQSLDSAGVVHSFLSTDDNYRYVKQLHEKNLFIPVSGDFAGPKALRGIGAWIAKQNATVSAFYLSNVEQYLYQDGKQAAFYANVATLPLTPTSVFIRPYSLRTPQNAAFGGRGGGFNFGTVRPLCPITAYLKAFSDGKATSNADALSCATP